ncbi:MAG: Cysteine--tRNA ligase [Chlamydiae bacterium]|nr:Cysteine--tRNA ligase [Chlamydiota bacterium]
MIIEENSVGIMKSKQKLPQLVLFNTETRSKEPLIPLKNNHISMYTCGPTVYDYAHIGNFRTYMFEDILRRTIKFLGMEITQVMNITDVDDKTIRGATKKGISLDEYTKPFLDAFFDDLDALNIERVEYYPAATDYIPQMIKMIEVLLEKGFAYKGKDGSVYYNIQKFPRYGCLSHLKLDELKTGASERVATDEYDKEHVADFVLWKAYDPERDGTIYWESPFGQGRPGWHMECSAMATEILGETLDIHVGGVDNLFPHHENEIAQSEACSGKQFSKMWLHSEHLLVDSKKMSKSLGNFYTFRDLINKGYTAKQVRYMLLQTHYKTQLNFTLPGLEGAKGSLDRIQNFVERLQGIPETVQTGCHPEKFQAYLDGAFNFFAQSLADDLNISVALSAVFDLIRDINALCDSQEISYAQAQEVLELMAQFDTVLGVISFELEEEYPKEVLQLVEQRQQARQSKDWGLADQIRDAIHEHGYTVEDTPTGPRLHKQ